jgi:hypothetical protein
MGVNCVFCVCLFMVIRRFILPKVVINHRHIYEVLIAEEFTIFLFHFQYKPVEIYDIYRVW